MRTLLWLQVTTRVLLAPAHLTVLRALNTLLSDSATGVLLQMTEDQGCQVVMKSCCPTLAKSSPMFILHVHQWMLVIQKLAQTVAQEGAKVTFQAANGWLFSSPIIGALSLNLATLTKPLTNSSVGISGGGLQQSL